MELFFKFIKFAVVGFSGMVIDFAVTWLFKERLKANKYIANSVGFIAAATNNYILNRVWTFKSLDENIPREFFSFFTVSVVGLMINNLIIYLLTDKLNVKFYFAKLIAIGVTVIWNFFANYLVTFRIS